MTGILLTTRGNSDVDTPRGKTVRTWGEGHLQMKAEL